MLASIALNEPDVELATRKLVDTAINSGSRDNVTAIVFRFNGVPA